VLRKKTQDEIKQEKLAGKPLDYEVFMAVPRTMGYDRRGNDLWKRDEKGQLLIGERDDEVSEVAEVFVRWLKGKL
jgi:type I restriction enzyme M protein